ncbi:MAG: hypothetical protein AAGI07_19815, partial [Bacteroidota bacterium]
MILAIPKPPTKIEKLPIHQPAIVNTLIIPSWLQRFSHGQCDQEHHGNQFHGAQHHPVWSH